MYQDLMTKDQHHLFKSRQRHAFGYWPIRISRLPQYCQSTFCQHTLMVGYRLDHIQVCSIWQNIPSIRYGGPCIGVVPNNHRSLEISHLTSIGVKDADIRVAWLCTAFQASFLTGYSRYFICGRVLNSLFLSGIHLGIFIRLIFESFVVHCAGFEPAAR